MSLLDRFLGKAAPAAVKPALSPFSGLSTPSPKSIDQLAAYRGWVYACVSVIAETIAATDIELERKDKTGWTAVESHIALDLLNDVNPLMTSSDLLYATQAYLELTGESFWYVPAGRATGFPAEIWPLDPTRMNVVRSAKTIIGGYTYRSEGGELVPLQPNEIIFFKKFHPLNRFRGMGTVAAAALSVDTDTYAAEYNRNFFYNAATPAGVLTTDGTLTPEQFDRLQAQWNTTHQGYGNAHKTAILESGLTYQAIAPSQRDMQFLEQRKYSRDEILGMFRVPPNIVSSNEDINRANAQTGEYSFTKYTIKPKLQFIVDRLNEFYLPLFNLDQRLYRFTYADPVPENVELDLQRKQTGLASGWLTINEVREEEGLDAIPDGDVPYISSTLIPLGTPSPAVVAAQPQVDDEPGMTDEPLVEAEEQQPSTGSSTGGKSLKEADQTIEKRIAFISQQINRTAPQVETLFRERKNQILAAISDKQKDAETDAAASKDTLLKRAKTGLEAFIEALTLPIKDALTLSLVSAGDAAALQLNIDLNFEVTNPAVTAWLETHALESAKSIADTTQTEVRRLIVDGVEQGQSTKQIGDAIGQFFDEQSQWRAQRVARTEVISGYAQGSLEAYRQSGVVTGKSWLTAGDERVDDECAQNQDQGVIGLDDLFASGVGAPPTHPNCRCTLLAETGSVV